MDSDDQLSPIGESSVPVPNRTFRRLKKAKSISELCPESETLDFEEVDGEDSGKSGLQSANGFDGVEEEDGVRSDLNGLGVEDGVTSRKVLDFDSMPECNPALDDLGEKGEDEICDLETGDEIKDSETKEAGKKRSVLETSDSEGKETEKSKKRSKKSDDFDELPISNGSMNMSKKERRENLDKLRAENQRLLRETRDAAFVPAPLVRKPISSVLEKIRRRKEENSKQFLSRKKSKSVEICDNLFKEDGNDIEEIVVEEKNEDIIISKQSPGGKDCLEDSAGPSGNLDSPNKTTESNPTSQDPSLRSQTTNSGDERLEKTSSRSLEEVMTPSIIAMNLKVNTSLAHDK